MEMILRGSEYQDFLQCRKKWYHSWVEQITPIRPDNKLFFGNLFHKWLEEYYISDCNVLQADLIASTWMNEQDMGGMEQTDIDDLKKLFKGVRENYINTYHENDKGWKVLGTEVQFYVKLLDDTFYTGTIDLVYEVDGKVYFSDHKTVSSLDMYEEKSQMDRQISRYWWTLKSIAEGLGRIKDDRTDTWIVWEELKGKEIAGFTYNLIAKDYPREPKILKSGKLSTDKSQKTTYAKYVAKLNELGLGGHPSVSGFPSEYNDMIRVLAEKQDPFLRRVNVIRTDKELESAMWEFVYTANDMHDVNVALALHPEHTERLTYRNIGTHCQSMCQFKSLCQAAISGENVDFIKKFAYKKNEER